MLHIKEIHEKDKWDEFIINSGLEYTFFQAWNWGDFQQRLGNEVVRIGFFEAEKQIGAALAIIISAKRGKYIYIRNGPVAFWQDNIITEAIIYELKKLARQKGAWFVRMSPLVTTEDDAANYLKAQNFPISPMYDVDALDTWILNLNQTEEEILQNMRKSTRYEIRKAEKDGVTIETSTDAADLHKFFPIYQDTITRQKWTGYSEKYISSQFETFVKDKQAKLYLAKYNNTYIAGSIFIYYGNSSFYHYSGSLTEYKKIPAPALIQWKNIQEAKARGLSLYNFWGIAPDDRPNHPWQGLTFFKQGFGGYAKHYLPTVDIPINNKYYLTKFIDLFQKKVKGY